MAMREKLETRITVRVIEATLNEFVLCALEFVVSCTRDCGGLFLR